MGDPALWDRAEKVNLHTFLDKIEEFIFMSCLFVNFFHSNWRSHSLNLVTHGNWTLEMGHSMVQRSVSKQGWHMYCTKLSSVWGPREWIIPYPPFSLPFPLVLPSLLTPTCFIAFYALITCLTLLDWHSDNGCPPSPAPMCHHPAWLPTAWEIQPSLHHVSYFVTILHYRAGSSHNIYPL